MLWEDNQRSKLKNTKYLTFVNLYKLDNLHILPCTARTSVLATFLHIFQFGQCVHLVPIRLVIDLLSWNRSSLRSELCELDLSSSFNHYRHRFFRPFCIKTNPTRSNRESTSQFRMITPVFKVIQTEELIIIEIIAKYSKENVFLVPQFP